jgi:hypothetical protein
MMLRLGIVISLTIPGIALAEPMVTDAFGIYTPSPDQAARNTWAGYSEIITDQAMQVKTTKPTATQDVLFYLGPKSLIAGGHAGEAMTLVLDTYGNLVADGAEVTITTGHHSAIVSTKAGVAALFYKPGTIAGQFHAGAGVGSQQSERAEYQVVPDLAGINPTWPDTPAPMALFEDYTDLKTAPLADEFGNGILDGAGGVIHVDHSDGQVTLLPFVSAQGIGQARMLTRDIPGDGQLSLNFERRTSPILQFDMDDPKASGILQIHAITDAETASTKLRLGPFLTTEGHALNDGSQVKVKLTTSDGKVLHQSGWILNGLVTVTFLMDGKSFPLDVEVTSPLGSVSRALKAPEAAPEPEVMP